MNKPVTQFCVWCRRIVDVTNRSELSEEVAGTHHAWGKPDDEAFCNKCECQFFELCELEAA